MDKQISPPVLIAVIIVVVIALGFGIWHALKPPAAPAPLSTSNMAHGVPPPMSPRSNAYHGP